MLKKRFYNFPLKYKIKHDTNTYTAHGIFNSAPSAHINI